MERIQIWEFFVDTEGRAQAKRVEPEAQQVYHADKDVPKNFLVTVWLHHVRRYLLTARDRPFHLRLVIVRVEII